MKYVADEELAAWMAFAQLGIGWGTKLILSIYEHTGSLAFAWEASSAQLRFVPILKGLDHQVSKFIERRKEINPERLLQVAGERGVSAIPLCDQRYPARLKQIPDPPLVLYTKGRLSAHDLHHVVGVVGTRRPTSYGQKMTKEISGGLASNGITIVSGMAIGVDSFAHRAAIESGAQTIAVLGCGADVCYPSSNRPLYDMLISGEHGAVVSEYFPGTKPETWRFPARNRIIAGLSEAVVVIEAGESSGSLITAKLAFEYCREVFAVPGRVDSPMSAGTNALIASNQAHLITGYQDVMNGMNWARSEATAGQGQSTSVVELFGKEKELYDLLSVEPMHFDVLCERTGMAAGELSATLTMLELAGVVVRHAGDHYSRS
jgi:DNA processing protein